MRRAREGKPAETADAFREMLRQKALHTGRKAQETGALVDFIPMHVGMGGVAPKHDIMHSLRDNFMQASMVMPEVGMMTQGLGQIRDIMEKLMGFGYESVNSFVNGEDVSFSIDKAFNWLHQNLKMVMPSMSFYIDAFEKLPMIGDFSRGLMKTVATSTGALMGAVQNVVKPATDFARGVFANASELVQGIGAFAQGVLHGETIRSSLTHAVNGDVATLRAGRLLWRSVPLVREIQRAIVMNAVHAKALVKEEGVVDDLQWRRITRDTYQPGGDIIVQGYASPNKTFANLGNIVRSQETPIDWGKRQGWDNVTANRTVWGATADDNNLVTKWYGPSLNILSKIADWSDGSVEMTIEIRTGPRDSADMKVWPVMYYLIQPDQRFAIQDVSGGVMKKVACAQGVQILNMTALLSQWVEPPSDDFDTWAGSSTNVELVVGIQYQYTRVDQVIDHPGLSIMYISGANWIPGPWSGVGKTLKAYVKGDSMQAGAAQLVDIDQTDNWFEYIGQVLPIRTGYPNDIYTLANKEDDIHGRDYRSIFYSLKSFLHIDGLSMGAIRGVNQFLWATNPLVRDERDRQQIKAIMHVVFKVIEMHARCGTYASICRTVNGVVDWHWDDLNYDACVIAPRLERPNKCGYFYLRYTSYGLKRMGAVGSGGRNVAENH